MATHRICECCGQRIRNVQKHFLTAQLVKQLALIAAVNKHDPVHVGDQVVMSHSGYDNYQKLRYFDLLEMSYNEAGEHMLGYWNLTTKGRLFLLGKGYCSPIAWVFEAERIRFEGEPIEISQVKKIVRVFQDWAADSRPLGLFELYGDAEDSDDDPTGDA